jgi:hypothetical protein
MHNKRWLLLLAMSVAVMDMGFGKAMANIVTGMSIYNMGELWTFGSYASAFDWYGDIVIGLMAGATGIWLAAYAFLKIWFTPLKLVVEP